MHAPAGLGGKSVCATLIAAAPEIDRSVVTACREIEDVAVTLLPGLSDRAPSWRLELKRRNSVLSIYGGILRPALLGRAAQPPRIWRT